MKNQHDIAQTVPDPLRRKLLKYSVLGSAMAAPAFSLMAKPQTSSAHIVIVGAGAAGIAMANRLRAQLSGNRITLIGARQQHHYQPGYTMIASGLWQPNAVITTTREWLPGGIDWVAQDIRNIHPEQQQVELEDSSRLSYDLLVVATGCQLNFAQIEGMEEKLIGQNGVGCVYAGADGAFKTSQQIDQFVAKGSGKGIFTLTHTFLKCAGAPIKMTFTSLSRLERSGNRQHFDISFTTPFANRLFTIPVYNEFVLKRFAQQEVNVQFERKLTAIDASARQAYFTDAAGAVLREDYDFIHVVPPMSAPDAIRHSGLAWTEGPFADDWLEVDQYTLQHRRYPNIFGLGDVIGTPLGKTAASVKMQAPVVEQNILSYLNGHELKAQYNGYTSCPLITGIGKAILAEFGYGNKLLPSFGFISPTEESWAVWVMKEKMLQPAYYAVLSGKV